MTSQLIKQLWGKKAFMRNLASYTTTSMDERYSDIINSSLPYNLANRTIYKELDVVEKHCIAQMANMFKARESDNIDGMSTVGSSEAILIYLLMLKITFAKNINKPNIIISQHTHFSWSFAASILGIAVKTANVKAETLNIDENHLNELLDKDTLTVILTAGTTLTGVIEDVSSISEEIKKFNQLTGCDVYIHIDAAIGGFVWPFSPDVEINGFNLDNVNSINISSHKYGGVYPSCGWLIFKKEKFNHNQSAISFDYLFEAMHHTAVNFSMPAAFVICQYEIFCHEKLDYYFDRTLNYFNKMLYLQDKLKSFGVTIINDNVIKAPVIVFDIEDEIIKEQFSDLMFKVGGWHIPCYKINLGEDSNKYHRVVIKDNICDEKTMESFIEDIGKVFNR
jgi:glutamate decarboxylase